MRIIRMITRILFRFHGKKSFLINLYLKNFHSDKRVRLLDIGCGNNSVKGVKDNFPGCYYIGIDVGDYNLNPEFKGLMEEYHVVSSEKFADKIFEFKDSVDIVISNHNIEHCNEPERVLNAMGVALKSGGNVFMAFPSEESVNFPHRYGTLNFYDDSTHQNVPNWNAVLSTLKSCGIGIVYKCKNYRPFLARMVGRINERKSIESGKVLNGTWEYYGFESIIWGKKF